MHSVLKDIVERKFREVAAASEAVPLEVLKERISELGRPRNFFNALVDRRHPDLTHVIAEVKRKSPSAGVIREDFGHPAHLPRAGDPAEIGPVIAFVGSRVNSYMTGADVNVDGGSDFC